MLLVIDTAVPGKIVVALAEGGRLAFKLSLTEKRGGPARGGGRSEKLLPLIDRLFSKNGLKPSVLKGIIVVTGPGSFTALRIALVAANTMAAVLGIPVAGVRSDEFDSLPKLIEVGTERMDKSEKGKIVLPFYGKAPDIT